MNKAIDEVVEVITSSSDYKSCIELKKRMSNNQDVCELVEQIKKLQKKYVLENDSKILTELKSLEDRLNSIPIYAIYMQHLEKVNEMINYVKDELNNYFYQVLNK